MRIYKVNELFDSKIRDNVEVLSVDTYSYGDNDNIYTFNTKVADELYTFEVTVEDNMLSLDFYLTYDSGLDDKYIMTVNKNMFYNVASAIKFILKETGKIDKSEIDTIVISPSRIPGIEDNKSPIETKRGKLYKLLFDKILQNIPNKFSELNNELNWKFNKNIKILDIFK